ncbi:MAG TPA: hypothetical protein VJV75_04100 [Candidatus Polarisedimenticolia bacterium]|nr:hypothetical protein [Candidatus Polarisedimenticolia bacterium]
MKKSFVFLAVCLAPALAFAQDDTKTYTNADLAKFQVPGAYTNQDLKRLPSLPVAKAPATSLPAFEPAPVPTGAMQAWYDSVRSERARLQAEIDVEKELVEFSESPMAGDSRSFDVRLGYRAQARPLIIELQKRVMILDRELETVLDEARKAGATLDRR